MRLSFVPWWLPAAAALLGAGGTQSVPLPVSEFKNVDRDSGKDRYFRLVNEDGHPYLAVDYKPPMETETLGYRLPDNLRESETRVSWRWRVRSFPKGGDECFGGGDSQGAV